MSEPQKSFIIDFIRRTYPINDDVGQQIISQFKHRQIPKGHFFLKKGTISNEYLLLQSGYLRSFINNTEGDDVTINFYSPPSTVFEVASFFQRKPSQENFHALTDCEGWVLSFEELNGLFHNIPEFREFGRSMLVAGFVNLKIRSLAMINTTAEVRYEELLKANPGIFKISPLKFIASYLGVTDSSLSRIRKELVGK